MSNPAERPRQEMGGQGANPDDIGRKVISLIKLERAVNQRPDLNFLKKKLAEWGFGQLDDTARKSFFDILDELKRKEELGKEELQLIGKACDALRDGGGESEPVSEPLPKPETVTLRVDSDKREKEPVKGEKKLNRMFLGYSLETDAEGNWVVYEKYQTLDKRRGRYREQPPSKTAIEIPREISARMKADPDFRQATVEWLAARRRELGPESESSERLRLFPDRVDDEDRRETSFEPRWKYGVTTRAGKRRRISNDLTTGVTKWTETDKAAAVENPDEIPWDILDMIQKFEYGEMLRRGKAPEWEKRTYHQYVEEMKADGHDVTTPYWKDGGYNSWIGKAAQRKRENIISEELTTRIVERWMRQQGQEAAEAQPAVAIEPPAPKEMKALPEWRGEAGGDEAPTEPDAGEQPEAGPTTGKDVIRKWVPWIAKPEVGETPVEETSERPVEPVAKETPAAAPKVRESEPVTDEMILEKAKPLVNQQIVALAKLYKLPDEAADLAEWSAKVVRASLADSYRRQNDKETAVRMLKDDAMIGKLSQEALVQISRLDKEDDETDRRAEALFQKYSPSRRLPAEKPAESPEGRLAKLRRSLSREVIMGLSDWSREEGFEDAVARVVGLAESVLTGRGVTDCAKIDEAGELKITDRKKFDESMRKMYRRISGR